MEDDTPRPDALARARELHDAGSGVTEIAGLLQTEGFTTVRGGPWTRQRVWQILNIPVAAPVEGTVPCSLCGRPTVSRFGVCTRDSCSTENARLVHEQAPVDKVARNKVVRRSRQAQKGELSVYAVWFPAPRVLKVGFTAHTQGSIFVSVARRKAVHRGWDALGSSCIWKRPGDTRTEAWMQATLSFRWWPAFEQKHNRICEWLKVPDLQEGEVVEVLDEVYRLTPADVREMA